MKEAAETHRRLSLDGYEICCSLRYDVDDKGKLLGIAIPHADQNGFCVRDVYVDTECDQDDRATELQVRVSLVCA